MYIKSVFNNKLVYMQVVVRSPVVSQYVIRTQPSDAAVSTVECAALALAALEDTPRIYDILVRPLTALCQHQVSCFKHYTFQQVSRDLRRIQK